MKPDGREKVSPRGASIFFTAAALGVKRRRLLPVVPLTGWAAELEPGGTREVEVVVAKPFTRELRLVGVARAVPDRVRPGCAGPALPARGDGEDHGGERDAVHDEGP